VIVIDTGVLVALGDRGDANHRLVSALYDSTHGRWIVPWAVLPEVDYLLTSHVGPQASDVLLRALADGSFHVEWGEDEDFARAQELNRRHAALKLGLVDAIVMATAERLVADAIGTFDRRHFGAVTLKRTIELLPREPPARRRT